MMIHPSQRRAAAAALMLSAGLCVQASQRPQPGPPTLVEVLDEYLEHLRPRTYDAGEVENEVEVEGEVEDERGRAAAHGERLLNWLIWASRHGAQSAHIVYGGDADLPQAEATRALEAEAEARARAQAPAQPAPAPAPAPTLRRALF